MRQGTILPRQLRKHGSGSYPLDISGETAPASWLLSTELDLSGRCLVVSCWYCVFVEPWVETERERGQLNTNPWPHI